MELITTTALIAGLVELGKTALGKASERVGDEAVTAAKKYWPKVKVLLGFSADPPPEELDEEVGKAVYHNNKPEVRELLRQLLEQHKQETIAIHTGSVRVKNENITARDYIGVTVGSTTGDINIIHEKKAADPPVNPLEVDRQAFHECAKVDTTHMEITFFQPPTAAAIRHAARFPPKWSFKLGWSGGDDPFAPEAFRNQKLMNVIGITFGWMAVHWYIQEFIRPDTGFTFLDWLSFHGLNRQLTDAALCELAQPESGLRTLSRLYLGNTHITDVALKELTRADTALKGLTLLDLNDTHVADAGVAALAHPNSGMKNLTELRLRCRAVTDAGVMELGHPDGSLKSLTRLDLTFTQMTDAGLIGMVRPDTGLKMLASLDLYFTKVGDAGIAKLACPGSGLKTLAALNLNDTLVTDAGMIPLARSQSGLNSLKWLSLESTAVTDAFLEELSRPDGGLRALTTLKVGSTKVTAAGIEALKKSRPGLTVE